MFRKSVTFLCVCGACLGALLRWPASWNLLAEMPPPAPGGLVSILGSITESSLRRCSMFRESVAFLCVCGACLGDLLRWPASWSLLAEMPPPTLRRLNLVLILGSTTQSCLRT
jgi:fluoride ion exporter CrcB/FEX